MTACYKIMCGCECCIYAKSIHSSLLSWRDRYFKNPNIKTKMTKAEGLVKNHITYMKHIKIQWCHMGVIFLPKHQIWQMLQCAHTLSLIMHFHTRNMYCGAVPTVLVSIFLTKKKNMTKQHPQLGFTFNTSLDVVLFMVEYHWTTRKYVTCVNKNLYQINLQKIYTRKELVMMETTISDFHTSF